MDTDYENVSVKETLSRRRTILENFCKAKKLHVAEVLEEVVSGESLYARPEMMRFLDMINEKKKTTLQIIPTTQHILDNYDMLTILEKNQLWKLVLKKVTVYRSQDDELSIQLYPNLPK